VVTPSRLGLRDGLDDCSWPEPEPCCRWPAVVPRLAGVSAGGLIAWSAADWATVGWATVGWAAAAAGWSLRSALRPPRARAAPAPMAAMNYGLNEQLPNLGPGQHLVQVEFVAADHAPFEPRVVAQAAFIIRP
jgi:hypothetical protein